LKDGSGNCKVDDLCAININNLLNSGIRKIGIVFNTDPHYKSGQHWISLYVDLYDDSCFFGGKGVRKHKKQKKHRLKYKKHKKDQAGEVHKIHRVKNGVIKSRGDLQEQEQNMENEKRCSGMYYFDSQGKPPLENILNLMENLCKQGDNCNIKFQKSYNDVQHQIGNTECGIYSIHFLTTMLKGTKFQDYIKDIKGDKVMESLRKEFFVSPDLMN
jgi:hypothetical protein